MLTTGKCQQLPKHRRNVLLVVLKHDPFGLLLWFLSLFVCFVFVYYSLSFLSEETFRCLIVSMPLLFCNTCSKYKYKTFNSSTASHTVKLLFWSTHGKWVLFPTEQWKHCAESVSVSSGVQIRTQSTNKACSALLTSLHVLRWKGSMVYFIISLVLLSHYTQVIVSWAEVTQISPTPTDFPSETQQVWDNHIHQNLL